MGRYVYVIMWIPTTQQKCYTVIQFSLFRLCIQKKPLISFYFFHSFFSMDHSSSRNKVTCTHPPGGDPLSEASIIYVLDFRRIKFKHLTSCSTSLFCLKRPQIIQTKLVNMRHAFELAHTVTYLKLLCCVIYTVPKLRILQ